MSIRYHFHPAKGWMNDPNGLVWFRGKYHAFFQHNPHASDQRGHVRGHAVPGPCSLGGAADCVSSRYEYDKRGCWSARRSLKMTCCVTYLHQRKDGVKDRLSQFRRRYSLQKVRWKSDSARTSEDTPDFRDPAVTKSDILYVAGRAKTASKGPSLSFGGPAEMGLCRVFMENAGLGAVIECPSFSKFGDGYLFMCSGSEDETVWEHQVFMAISTKTLCPGSIQPRRGRFSRSFQRPTGALF